MNYREERQHDNLLINLVVELAAAKRLDILETILNLPNLGALEIACRRRDFDVELTFQNASVLVETKVDADEGGRWGTEWQTERIQRVTQAWPHLKSDKYYFFITYGTSEFFTKRYRRGPANTSFQHVGLDRMIGLVRRVSSLSLPGSPLYAEWLCEMKREQRTRLQAPNLLAKFGTFRSSYLKLRGDVDFDRNRILCCAPEIVFPVFGRLAEFWNNGTQIRANLGQVAVYPVERMMPTTIVDSVLCFWELWDTGRPTFSGRFPGLGSRVYFEMNEDLNLNLKLDEPGSLVPDNVILDVQTALDTQICLPGVRGKRRLYRQGTRVIYEWDFGFPNHAPNLARLASSLCRLVTKAVAVLA